MKKLIIALGVLGLLVVIAIGGVLFYAVNNATALAQEYKPEMEKAASEALGSTVTLGDISAKVFPTARVTINAISVASDDEAITLDRVDLEVALLPLLSNRLEVRNFVIDRPNIKVYLEEDGIFIAGLPRTASDESEEPEEETAPAGDSEFSLALERFALNDASILVVNKVAEQEYRVDGLTVNARMDFANQKVNLTGLDGKARLLEQMDMTLDGKAIAYELVGGALEIDGLKLDVEGNRLALAGALDPNDASKKVVLTGENIRPGSFGPAYDLFAPSLNDMDLKGAASAEIHFAWDPDAAYDVTGVVQLADMGATVGGMTVNALTGGLDLNADANAIDAKTEGMTGKLAEEAFAITTAASLKEMDAGLDPLTIDIFGGQLDSKGQVTLDGNMPFEASLNIAGMQMEPMVKTLLPDTPANIAGTLAKVNGNMKGTLDDNMMPSLVGQVEVLLNDGLIKEVNLGQQVLGAVDNVPFLADTLLGIVPERFKPFLNADQTVLKSVSGSFDVAQETMTTDDLMVESDFFTMDAKGTIGFDSNLNLDTVIHFNPEFSKALVDSTKEIGVLLDDQGRLSMPVKVSGVPPKLAVVPNVGNLLEGAVKNTVRDLTDSLLSGEEAEEGEESSNPVGGLINRLRGNNP